jgi:hypothetical protein
MEDSAPIEIDVQSLKTHQVAPDGSVICLNIENAWRLEGAAGSKDFILTMGTADGFEVAFALSATTIAQMLYAVKDQSASIEKRRAMLSS